MDTLRLRTSCLGLVPLPLFDSLEQLVLLLVIQLQCKKPISSQPLAVLSSTLGSLAFIAMYRNATRIWKPRRAHNTANLLQVWSPDYGHPTFCQVQWRQVMMQAEYAGG